MDIKENVMRIKDNLFLIGEKRFVELVTDTDYKVSFIYLVACLVLSLPLEFIFTSVSEGTLEALIYIPLAFLISIPVAYVVYGIQHLLLKALGGQGTFLQSVQVFIYGSTLTLIFGSIPIIGSLLGFITLANTVVGSSKIHKISIWRAIFALVVVPIIVIILIVAIAASVLGLSMMPGL